MDKYAHSSRKESQDLASIKVRPLVKNYYVSGVKHWDFKYFSYKLVEKVKLEAF